MTEPILVFGPVGAALEVAALEVAALEVAALEVAAPDVITWS